MAEIFKFQNKEEENVCCEACETTNGFLEIALTCEDEEELRAVLRGLYDIAHREGYRDALVDDVSVKMEILDDLNDDEKLDL